jgi:bifunctional non-homologous end joining protein LigD
VPCEAAFDHEDWRFSVDWDGMRALLGVGPGGQPRLVDERLRDVSELFPEIAAAAVALADRPAVLDGVVAVLDPEGRPDLAALSLRVAGSAAGRERPVVYLATDLLHLDGAPLTGWTLDRRQQALAALLAPQARLQAPGWVVGHGRAFCEAAAERGLPAVLARRGDAPYRPGVASPERLRIALEERSDAVVAAAMRTPVAHPRRRHAAPGGLVSALLLAEQVDGRLVESGRVAADWPAEIAAWLGSRLDELAMATGLWPVDVTGGERLSWLRPDLCATVRHHGRDGGGRFRLPSVVALRSDRDPAWCIRRTPVPPPLETPVHGGFRPTVLHTLPFDAG